MKNKHLVQLFLATLLLGLLTRLIPWHPRDFWKNALIRVEPGALQRLLIRVPGAPDLAIERAEDAWFASQNNRVVAVDSAQIAAMQAVFAALPILQAEHHGQRDTFGCHAQAGGIQVLLYLREGRVEECWLGREVVYEGRAATFVRMPRHEGIYLVPGHLRGLFAHSLDDFRVSSLVNTTLGDIRRIGIAWPDTMPLYFEKRDTAADWQTPDGTHALPGDSVAAWLRLFPRLNGSPFADNFDESQASETLIATVFWETDGQERQTIRFFSQKPPNVPEDVSGMSHRIPPALYVAHSSQNPLNYFAIADSQLVRRICYGLQTAAEQMPK